MIGTNNLIPKVTRNLLIINVIVWFAELAFARIGINLVDLLGMHYIGSGKFKIYQLVTHFFLHSPATFSHLFSNMFGLFMFGGLLERVWGEKRFLIYYLITGVGAGLIQQLTWWISMTPEMLLYKDFLIVVGASGAIFAILLAFGMLFPNLPVFIMFIPIPIKAKWLVIGYGVIELVAGLSSGSGSNVAHFTHLGGMLFGFVLIMLWRQRERKKKENEWQDFY
ncbi:MAG: rhomboid family intramembrane serine protease [Porphyromonas sp.]|nr:rhomboid family intramembrane serine protease [Porphyromonas sp.]